MAAITCPTYPETFIRGANVTAPCFTTFRRHFSVPRLEYKPNG